MPGGHLPHRGITSARSGPHLEAHVAPAEVETSDISAIRFHHLSISARKLDESIRFHEKMFGLDRIPTA
jgi:hypothetical protein